MSCYLFSIDNYNVDYRMDVDSESEAKNDDKMKR